MSTSAKFLTLQEVADLLRVSLKTVQRWRLERRIRCYKAGRRVLVIEQQILEDLGIVLGAKAGSPYKGEQA